MNLKWGVGTIKHNVSNELENNFDYLQQLEPLFCKKDWPQLQTTEMSSGRRFQRLFLEKIASMGYTISKG